jgi:D-cysteine desulfhydrase
VYTLPLIARFPGVAAIPRVRLGNYPTPIEHIDGIDGVSGSLWIKRDDLSASRVGGNKVRALEFLLGEVEAGDRVVTAGSVGSTHALTTAIHARARGARASLGLWRQEMNPAAERVAARIAGLGERRRVFPVAPLAIAWAIVERWRGARWIPVGGTSPLGILGHVNAALELADQVAAGALPAPGIIVVPFGTGGTAAGLVLGCAIAALDVKVIGVRVVPSIVARKRRVLMLARHTAALLRQFTDVAIPDVRSDSFSVVDQFYGGAYGRETPAGRDACERLAPHGVMLDATYSAKACAAALEATRADGESGRGPTLLWLTFDGRVLRP